MNYDIETRTIRISYLKHERDVELIPGKIYRVEPINPRKLKHRGRECLLVDFVPVSKNDVNKVAKVRFLDNNRVGRVEFDDLIPA